MRDWLARAALWQVWAYFFLAWTLIQMVLTAARSPLGAVPGGLLFATGMTAVTARRRRGDSQAAGRITSPADVQQLDRAIETGRVPLDPADRTALRGLVDRRLRQARIYLWFGTVLWCAFIALGVTLLLATHSFASGLETAVFVFLLICGTVVMRKQRSRAEAVKRLLDGQEEDPAATGASSAEG